MKEVVWKTWEASHVWIKSKEKNSSERIKRPKQLKVEGFELLMVNIFKNRFFSHANNVTTKMCMWNMALKNEKLMRDTSIFSINVSNLSKKRIKKLHKHNKYPMSVYIWP